MVAGVSKYFFRFEVNPSGALSPKVDNYEKVAKVLLLPLSVSRRVNVTIVDGKIASAQQRVIKRIKDIIVLIFLGSTSCLLFTLGGLGLLSLSKTHKVKCAVYRGTVLAASKNLKGALVAIKQALEIDPNSSFARAYLADIQRMQGQSQLALKNADQALKDEPSNQVALRVRSQALLSQNNPKKALQSIDKLLQRTPGHIPTLWMQARAYIQKKDFDKALTVTTALSKAKADAISIHLAEALIQYGNGKVDESKKSLDRILKVNRRHIEASTINALILANQSPPKLKEALKKARKLDPKRIISLRVKAHIYGLKGQYDKTLKVLLKILKLAPKDAWATAFKTVCENTKKSYEKSRMPNVANFNPPPPVKSHISFGQLLQEIPLGF